jgi:hypothetical protein
MKYARIISNVVVETFTPPAGVSIADCFHPSLVFEPIPDDVEAGWLVAEDGSFSSPPAPEPGPVVETPAP